MPAPPQQMLVAHSLSKEQDWPSDFKDHGQDG
jgi:hypothetical protein